MSIIRSRTRSGRAVRLLGSISVATLVATTWFAGPANASELIVTHSIISAGNISLTADETAAPGDDATIASTGSVVSTGGAITISAGDDIILAPGSIVHAATTVRLDTSSDTDGAANIVIRGSAQGAAAVEAVGSSSDNTFTVDFTTASLPSGLHVDGGAGHDTLDLTGATDLFLVVTSYDAVSGAISGEYYVDGSPRVSFENIEELTATPDLAITKDDGVTQVHPGDPIAYTVTASNSGVGIAGASVSDSVPAGITGVTWTCVASSGSACSASGSGDINDTVDLDTGGTVTYSVTGTVAATASGSIVNTATVATNLTDPTPADNSATDTDTVVAAPDTTDPTLNPVVSPMPIYLKQTGVTVTANATDSGSGVDPSTVSCGAIDTSTVGVHAVTCTATDFAGNTGSATVRYTVQYKIVAFYAPIPGSKWKVGQTVPIKIGLADVSGVLISDAQAATLVSSPCRVKVSITGAQTLASTCMRYTAAADQFIYNWKLTKSGTGAATVTVTLSYPGTTDTSVDHVDIVITKK